MVAKVMVSLPDELLWAVDAEAQRRGTTRSGLPREMAEQTPRRRSASRAPRMAQIRNQAGDNLGRGGEVAELVKAIRPTP